MDNVTVLTTGGTIDKQYPMGAAIRDLVVGQPIVKRLLRNVRILSAVRFYVDELMQKDSLDMTDDDRARIANACTNTSSSHIIITHGTDTIIDTARAVSAVIQPRRTVVLTGALVPACVVGSDAQFNVGFALAACLYAPCGVYIALNGLHEWNRCRKNPTTGIFEPLLEA